MIHFELSIDICSNILSWSSSKRCRRQVMEARRGCLFSSDRDCRGWIFPHFGVFCDTTSTVPLLTCVSSFRVSFSHRPVGICRMQWSFPSVPGVSIGSPSHSTNINNRSSNMNRKVHNVAKNPYHGVVFRFRQKENLGPGLVLEIFV
jgi:hypothetical protein